MKTKKKRLFIAFIILILAIATLTVTAKELNLKKVLSEMFLKGDYDYTVIAKVYDENIYKSEFDIYKKISIEKSDDEILKDIINSKLFNIEAQKMNISISNEELDEFINKQRDLQMKNGDESNQGYLQIKEICDKMDIKMEEYYDLPEVRGAYKNFLLKSKLIEVELSKQDKKLNAEEKNSFVEELKNKLNEKAKDKITIY